MIHDANATIYSSSSNSIEQAVSIASDLMSKGEEFDWVAVGLMSCQTTNGVSILNPMLSH